MSGADEPEKGDEGEDSMKLGKPSIKDFEVLQELGQGNFSTIMKVKRKLTGQILALKVIDKSEANRMKRRHANIYNEIYMEKRALTHLHGHPGIIEMLATFQDYGSLYYLLELCEGGEVWQRTMDRGKAVGVEPSLARFWMGELVAALEWMHSKKMVHRDVKPENIMIMGNGHIKLIDFGTAKDLTNTDLNGPEFVGTAQYMSPQAVKSETQGTEADLWALGCCLFHLSSGHTPFHAPSPYLCFLRIKEGLLRFPPHMGEDLVSLIKELLQYEPQSRLGSQGRGGYQALKAHRYWDALGEGGVDELYSKSALRIPRLNELCLRATGRHISQWATAQHIVRAPLPSHVDVSRIKARYPLELCALRHYLTRKGDLSEPGVQRLFHSSGAEAKAQRADECLRDYLGLTWENNGQWEHPFFFVHLGDPQVGMAQGGEDWAQEADRLRDAVGRVNTLRPKFVVVSGDMTQSVPGSASYEGQVQQVLKIMGKVSATIPVMYVPGNHDIAPPAAIEEVEGEQEEKGGDDPGDVAMAPYLRHFGADYYAYWFGGARCVVINTCLMCPPLSSSSRARLQDVWLEAELGVSQLNAHHIFVFGHHPLFLQSLSEEPHEVFSPIPKETRLRWLSTFARNKVKFIFAGHLHRNVERSFKAKAAYGHIRKTETVEGVWGRFEAGGERVCKLRVPTQGKKAKAAAAEGANEETKEEAAAEEEEEEAGSDDDWMVEDRPDVQQVVTSSVGGPLPPLQLEGGGVLGTEAESSVGLRVVRVYNGPVEHAFYELSQVPQDVELGEDRF